VFRSFSWIKCNRVWYEYLRDTQRHHLHAYKRINMIRTEFLAGSICTEFLAISAVDFTRCIVLFGPSIDVPRQVKLFLGMLFTKRLVVHEQAPRASRRCWSSSSDSGGAIG